MNVYAIDVAFLAIRLPHRLLAPTVRLATNIVHRTASKVRLHVVADQPAASLLHALRHQSPTPTLRSAWRVHSTHTAPSWVARLHGRLVARGCQGPVCHAYMHKPLLHLYLPVRVQKVIFLDSDVFLFSDIALLWQRFESFHSGQLIALASEENAFDTQEPVVAFGGISANGGVELLHLSGMRAMARQAGTRAGSTYTNLLWRYARRDPLLPLNGDYGVGMQGEQVLYSWMSIRGVPGHTMFGRLPCSWNVQVASCKQSCVLLYAALPSSVPVLCSPLLAPALPLRSCTHSCPCGGVKYATALWSLPAHSTPPTPAPVTLCYRARRLTPCSWHVCRRAQPRQLAGCERVEATV